MILMTWEEIKNYIESNENFFLSIEFEQKKEKDQDNKNEEK